MSKSFKKEYLENELVTQVRFQLFTVATLKQYVSIYKTVRCHISENIFVTLTAVRTSIDTTLSTYFREGSYGYKWKFRMRKYTLRLCIFAK
jgi:hypothetical protein